MKLPELPEGYNLRLLELEDYYKGKTIQICISINT